jgi:Mn2+/Fe2+ NRAMP family transporter
MGVIADDVSRASEMVTGRGLAGTLRKKFPRTLVIMATFALFVANTINVCADLAGMADAAEMLTGINSHWLVPSFGVVIAYASIRCRYAQIARILKWLALALFSYVIAGLIMRPDWSQVLAATFIPTLPKGREMWATLVAILGTTISPYLFFGKARRRSRRRSSTAAVVSRNAAAAAAGDPRPQDRRWHRHIFQLRDVFHHPDDRSDFAQKRSAN